MTFELVTIPTLEDNYNFLLHVNGKTALIDAPPELGPIDTALLERGWRVDEIWITHHDWDHIDGVEVMRERHGALVRGAANDQDRLPKLDVGHVDGDSFDFGDFAVTVMDARGHTSEHIAYYVPQANAAFTADSLMALGCGRVKGGLMSEMYDTITRLGSLPPETLICSGHEYTEANGRFALSIEPDNPDLRARIATAKDALSRGEMTVPTTLELELATNPYLRVGLQSVKDTLNMTDATDAEVFTEIRVRKDNFNKTP